ncbi:tail fiber domain-containing protein [candidate division WOR-3 bacterium]|nr:tail fiber domain-containing protein [candidate division WOR-3 bacterium]
MKPKLSTIFALILILAGGLPAASGMGSDETVPMIQSGWIEGTRPVETEASEGGKIMTVDTWWRTAGNSETVPGTHFLGTIDNKALEIRVNNQRAFRLEPNYSAPNVIGGYSGNSIASGKCGSTISGGGVQYGVNAINDNYSTIGGGKGNSTDSIYATVSGGWVNIAGGYGASVGGGSSNSADARYCVVSGGYDNEADSNYASIGGGYHNLANGQYARVDGGRNNTADSQYCFVGAGYSNLASDRYATIGGGYDNSAEADYTFIGGGYINKARGNYAVASGGRFSYADGDYSVVAGGNGNDAVGNYSVVCGGFSNEATGGYSTIGGGYSCEASGIHATVPGGNDNEANGYSSFAAGYKARANHSGSFVWADYQNGEEIASTGNDQFIVRAEGGVWFGTHSSPSWPTGSFIATSTGAYLSSGGTWTNASDRNLKEGFQPVDQDDILEKVAELPITSWNYKSENNSVKHIGPVAQDFHAAFGVGTDDKSISTIDADGVALVAIQALYKELKEKDAEIAELTARLEALEASQNK